MKTLVVFLLIFVAYSQEVSYETLVQNQWEYFKLKHQKVYASEDEDQYRLKIFIDNIHKINNHNKLYEMGLSSYEMGLNHLADLTEDEFLRLYTIQLPQTANLTDVETWDQDMEDFVIHALPTNMEESDLEEQVDWRTKGAVTSVKNQGQCGSCWSFSAAGALEGQWFIKKHILVDLSEQNLIDCSWAEGNHGCGGGWMPSAFKYIKKNKGIDSLASYPYEGRNNKCRFNPRNVAATVSQITEIPPGENELRAKVNSVGPIAIAMQVIGSFQLYKGGVYDDPNCRTNINHAMLAVGYGNHGGKDYWLVKNSWGTDWGEAGYVKMVRNRDNQCGIASAASYPVV